MQKTTMRMVMSHDPSKSAPGFPSINICSLQQRLSSHWAVVPMPGQCPEATSWI